MEFRACVTQAESVLVLQLGCVTCHFLEGIVGWKEKSLQLGTRAAEIQIVTFSPPLPQP